MHTHLHLAPAISRIGPLQPLLLPWVQRLHGVRLHAALLGLLPPAPLVHCLCRRRRLLLPSWASVLALAAATATAWAAARAIVAAGLGPD